MGTVRTLARRAHQLSSTHSSLLEEKQLLAKAFDRCSYPKNEVKQLLNPIGVSRKPIDPKIPKIGLPYLPGLSTSLSKFLKRWNISVFYRKHKTLGQLLYKRSPETDFFEQQNLVYRVNCMDCSKCYVGQTTRKFKFRLKNHKDAIRLNHTDNAIANHVCVFGHKIDTFACAEILAKENNSALLTAKEMLLIDMSDNFNNVTDISNLALSNLLRTIGV